MTDHSFLRTQGAPVYILLAAGAMGFQKIPIILTTVLLSKLTLAYPSLNEGHITKSWPPLHNQINEIAASFSPNCSLHVVRANESESFGPIEVPHLVSFPRQSPLGPKYRKYTRTGTHPISRDVLRIHCLLTVILPYLDPPYGYNNGLWTAYLMETGAQRYLKYPKYYVVLTNVQSRNEQWGMLDYDLWRTTHLMEAAPLLFLFYNLDDKITAADVSAVGVRVVCFYCPQLAQDSHCAGATECLGTGLTMLDEWVDGGKNVYWVVSRNEFYKDDEDDIREGFLGAHCHWPFLGGSSRHGACAQESTEDAALGFSLSSLNLTLQAMYMGEYRRTKFLLPRIQWSFADYHYDYENDRGIISPLHIFPFATVNRSRTSLKLITADGVRPKRTAIDLYLTPFDLASWFLTLVLIFGATSLVIAVLTTRRGHKSPLLMLRHGMFWISSALLEQPDNSNFSTSATTSGAPNGLLFLALLMCCVVNNVYRAYLNVGYVTGSEYETEWEEVKQVQDRVSDFLLYFAVSDCAWKEVQKGYAEIRSRDKVALASLRDLCRTECKMEVDEALCAFIDDFVSLMALHSFYRPCSLALFNSVPPDAKMGMFDELVQLVQDCPFPRVRFFFKININFRYFPIQNIQNVVKEELAKPRTAFVTTKDFLPQVWPDFEEAMKANTSLHFVHNYHRQEADASILQKPASLMVESSLKPEYTKLVTSRIKTLASSGIWEFWDAQDGRTRKIRKLDKGALDDFAPLTMFHDAIYLLFVLLGVLLAAGFLVFAVEFLVGLFRHSVTMIVFTFYFGWLLRKY